MFPGLPIYASKDPQNWTLIGNAINRPTQLSLAESTATVLPLDTGHCMVASGGLYAATIRYHNGTFYIVCTNSKTTDGGTNHNCLISTQDIWADEWSDPVYFDFQGIDPSIFFDDDGKVYVQGSWQIDRLRQPSCTIKQFEIDITTGKAISDTREI